MRRGVSNASHRCRTNQGIDERRKPKPSPPCRENRRETKHNKRVAVRQKRALHYVAVETCGFFRRFRRLHYRKKEFLRRFYIQIYPTQDTLFCLGFFGDPAGYLYPWGKAIPPQLRWYCLLMCFRIKELWIVINVNFGARGDFRPVCRSTARRLPLSFQSPKSLQEGFRPHTDYTFRWLRVRALTGLSPAPVF